MYITHIQIRKVGYMDKLKKYPKVIINAIKHINGILNKEFNKFNKTVAISLIEKTEGITAHTISVSMYEDIAKIITTDNKEYMIFQDIESANEYAIMFGSRMEDDPNIFEGLKHINSTVEHFYSNKVFLYGAEFVLSFDQQSKVILDNGMIAYRTL